MQAEGRVFKYGDNVDTDVIIPARYLNATTGEELAKHCMEDIDKEFIHKVQPGDIIVAEKNFGCGSSREHAPLAIKCAGVSCVMPRPLPGSFTAMPSISAFPSSSVRKPLRPSGTATRWRWILTAGSSTTGRRMSPTRDRRSLRSCRRSLPPEAL